MLSYTTQDKFDMMPTALPSLSSFERDRNRTVHALRSEALKRLYARRDALENLIRSLEDYLEHRKARQSNLIEFVSVGPKCW